MRTHKYQPHTGQRYTDIMSKDSLGSWAFLCRLVLDGQWGSSRMPDKRIIKHLLGCDPSQALITVKAHRRTNHSDARIVIKANDAGRRAVRLYRAQTCEHPRDRRVPSTKRAARRWGSMPVEECRCGAWRGIIADVPGAWHEDITIEDYNADED